MLYPVIMQHAVKYHGGATAIVTESGAVSFLQLEERAERLASTLVQRGFAARDRLAMLLPNCPEFIEIVYACARVGIIAVPVNTRYAVAEIDAVLADCEPKGILRHSSLPRPNVRVPWEAVIDQEPVEGSDGALPPVFFDPAAIFGLFYTSGTTGKAKGVMLTHQNLLANFHHTGQFFEMGRGECFLHAAPMFHAADFPAVFVSVAAGTAQTTIPKFDVQPFCAAVQRHRVTHSVLIPTMINFLTLYPDLKDFDVSSLRKVLYGGSPIAPEVLRRAREKLPGTRLVQGYGLTETSPVLTILTDEDHRPEKMLSCGKPPVGVEVRVVDLDGKPLPPNQTGEIAARGPNVMRGYWNKPGETARAIRDGWFHTGDVGHQDEEGYFYIVDRAKDMIVTGGENVYSTEVEGAIYEHPAVKEAAVIGIPDDSWGELVLACVVLKEGAALTAGELAAHCRTLLANYKIPRRVEFLHGELPKSGTGKILKRTLREPYWKGRSRAI